MDGALHHFQRNYAPRAILCIVVASDAYNLYNRGVKRK